MYLSLFQDSLAVVQKTAKETYSETNESINWWFWVAIIQFVIIIYLVRLMRTKRNHYHKQNLKKESLTKSIDFDNIINSSFNSNKIYDELKIKCHPDLFHNDPLKKNIAENIFQELTKNRNNIKRLIELKEKAKQELNINL